tara:strand:- start:900 stop:1043 length:144 start_codon:yes stop_codon:yes gene_type:complete
MNWENIIEKLDDKIDFMSESKMMHNRYWVHRALKTMRKLQNHYLNTK